MIFIICITSYRFKHIKPNKFHICYNFTIKTIKTLQKLLKQCYKYKQFPFPYVRLCLPVTNRAGVELSFGSASITEILQKYKDMTSIMNPRRHIP